MRFLDRYFYRFLVDLGAILGAKMEPKSMKNSVGKNMKKRWGWGSIMEAPESREPREPASLWSLKRIKKPTTEQNISITPLCLAARWRIHSTLVNQNLWMVWTMQIWWIHSNFLSEEHPIHLFCWKATCFFEPFKKMNPRTLFEWGAPSKKKERKNGLNHSFFESIHTFWMGSYHSNFLNCLNHYFLNPFKLFEWGDFRSKKFWMLWTIHFFESTQTFWMGSPHSKHFEWFRSLNGFKKLLVGAPHSKRLNGSIFFSGWNYSFFLKIGVLLVFTRTG